LSKPGDKLSLSDIVFQTGVNYESNPKTFLCNAGSGAGLLSCAGPGVREKDQASATTAAVEQTVARESEGATIKGFAAEVEKGQKFYEASLVVNGHNKDILIDKNGNVVEVEEQVSLDSLPLRFRMRLNKLPGRARSRW
jgi:hypothetical protein